MNFHIRQYVVVAVSCLTFGYAATLPIVIKQDCQMISQNQETLLKSIIDDVYRVKNISPSLEEICTALDSAPDSEKLSDASSCQWYYRMDTDNDRYPVNITYAVLKNCSGLTMDGDNRYCMDMHNASLVLPFKSGICEPITQNIPVIRRRKLETMTVTVGFGCRALPTETTASVGHITDGH